MGLFLAIENKQFSSCSPLKILNGVQMVFTQFRPRSKRTPLQRIEDMIRAWQLKGFTNAEIKKMLEHPVWTPIEKLIVAKPRENGRGDWVM